MSLSKNFMKHISYSAPLQLETFNKLRNCCSPECRKHWCYLNLQQKLSYASPERIPSMLEEHILGILRNNFSNENCPESSEMSSIWKDYCKTIEENAVKFQSKGKQK